MATAELVTTAADAGTTGKDGLGTADATAIAVTAAPAPVVAATVVID